MAPSPTPINMAENTNQVDGEGVPANEPAQAGYLEKTIDMVFPIKPSNEASRSEREVSDITFDIDGYTLR